MTWGTPDLILCKPCDAYIDPYSREHHETDGRHLVKIWAAKMEAEGFTKIDAEARPRLRWSLADELAESGIEIREGPDRSGHLGGEGRCVVTGTGSWAPAWAMRILRELKPMIPDFGARCALMRILHRDEKKRGAVIVLLDVSPMQRRLEDGIYDAIAELTGIAMVRRGP